MVGKIQRTLIFTSNSRRNSLSKVVSSFFGRVGNKQRYDATWWSVFELQNKGYSAEEEYFINLILLHFWNTWFYRRLKTFYLANIILSHSRKFKNQQWKLTPLVQVLKVSSANPLWSLRPFSEVCKNNTILY